MDPSGYKLPDRDSYEALRRLFNSQYDFCKKFHGVVSDLWMSVIPVQKL